MDLVFFVLRQIDCWSDQKHGKVIDHGMFHLSENARTCSFGSTGWVRLSDTTSIVALSPLPTSPAFTQLTPTQVAHSSLHMDSASEGLQRTGMGMHFCQFFLPNLSASQSGPCVMWKSTGNPPALAEGTRPFVSG